MNADATPEALRPGLVLRGANLLLLAVWGVVAAFPLVWIAAMSTKAPLDGFSAHAADVLLGPVTRAQSGGVSVLDCLVAGGLVALLLWLPSRFGADVAARLAPRTGGIGGAPVSRRMWLGWLLAAVPYLALALLLLLFVLPPVLRGLEAALSPLPLVGPLARPFLGVTGEHYRAVWVDNAFYRQFLNSMMVTGGVVLVSLSVGTLAGYALARTTSGTAFWLLIAALVFRALPHSVLVAGYLPPMITSHEWLQPLWDSPWSGWFLRLFAAEPPTLYGQKLAVILVLVAINQPFTIWMLRSFFANVPAELDEAARVDGCGHFEAFRRVIMPVMWPGVITTGLFSFLLAYNDFLVTSLLLDQQSQTMVPAIAGFLARENSSADQLQAIAAAVSIIAPLFLLVMVFQRQIVSGLTQGAVKG